VIILEGPDGGGKSTLQALLAKRYPKWKAEHSGGPIKSSEDYETRSRDLMDGDRRRIMDRCMFISEGVYAPVFDRALPPDYHQRARLFRVMVRPLVVWCLPQNYNLEDQSNPAFDTPEYVEKIRKRHALLAQRYSLEKTYWPSVDFDWNNLEVILRSCDLHVEINS
jgi:hypothetical protein